MKLDFAEKHYNHEHDRKNQIVQSLAMPLTAIGLLLAAVSYMCTNYNVNHISFTILESSFFIFISFTIIFIIFSIIFISLAVNGQEYEYMPDVHKLNTYYRDLEVFYKNNSQLNHKDMAKEKFESYLLDKYILCANKNWYSNLRKSTSRYWSHVNINFAIFYLILSLPGFISKHLQDPSPVNIHIL